MRGKRKEQGREGKGGEGRGREGKGGEGRGREGKESRRYCKNFANQIPVSERFSHQPRENRVELNVCSLHLETLFNSSLSHWLLYCGLCSQQL